ncbi:hypothetical protein HNR70_000430 [Brachybacterium aquaticum]|uniref:Uncharacterized protein n=1 Tax=Brachybacterium aquaticum TaxID=1432564 RepID=A0A841A9J3_9MICO|nr:hypothetical protein [Brachybacterium aquaticum]
MEDRAGTDLVRDEQSPFPGIVLRPPRLHAPGELTMLPLRLTRCPLILPTVAGRLGLLDPLTLLLGTAVPVGFSTLRRLRCSESFLTRPLGGPVRLPCTAESEDAEQGPDPRGDGRDPLSPAPKVKSHEGRVANLRGAPSKHMNSGWREYVGHGPSTRGAIRPHPLTVAPHPRSGDLGPPGLRARPTGRLRRLLPQRPVHLLTRRSARGTRSRPPCRRPLPRSSRYASKAP